MYLREYPEEAARIRSEAQRTAAYFTWEASVENLISKLENQAHIQRALLRGPRSPQPESREAIEKRLLDVAAEVEPY